MKKIIHNVENGVIEEIEMTSQEIELDMKLFQEIEKNRNAIFKQKNLENNARLTILQKMGITEDEAKLLLG